jgi:hypothetical protein
MKRPWSLKSSVGRVQDQHSLGGCHLPVRAVLGAVSVWVSLASAAAWGQPPAPFVPDATERSGLLMRFAGTPEFLPPDPYRDNFYNTRYADRGLVTHPNWLGTQGLYGLGMKTPDTKSVYPFFYGMPGQNSIDASSRPWCRPASSRGWLNRGGPSACITTSARMCRSTISTRSARDQAPTRSRSISTGCMGANRFK